MIVDVWFRWHEHDPEELISSVEQCIDGAVEAFEGQGHSREQIKAVGITNQRETTVVWDKTTGNALHNAIVWTDTRSKDLVRRLKRRLGASELISRCGIPLSTYPSVSKLLWLLENIPEVKDAYERGVLAFGTVDTWLTYKLNGATDRDVYVSDPSNASRTMFMNLESLQYDEDILDWFRIDDKKLTLPRIVRSSDSKAYGTLAKTSLKGVKITGCLGDQSAALVGQKGFTPGLAKNTYGTGCFLLYNVGSKPVISTHGLLTTVAFDFGEGNTMYALEGSIAVAGSSVKFLVDNFGFIESSAKLSALAETVEDNGMSVSSSYAESADPCSGIKARAERIVARFPTELIHHPEDPDSPDFEVDTIYSRILDSMEKDSGHALTELAVDGGMCNSDLIMQTQSDLIGIPVNRPGMRETTALGAAIAAGFAVGIWKSFDELKEVNTQGRTIFKPQIAEEEATKRFSRWTKAVEMSKGWANE
ncbi:glycerol kinase [Fusarium oxysporum f. sp. lycopersici 4287]|uniref:glycerol kinase n=1 Tax=Fusarium oxysporum f. sp. lycopersici (strain 4287 / CBS 123668 / FGSC 9935 / NRRL 34936) TaxID=426428 RepID=A0A0J9VDE4_FUSO4|nr:glycerol kinase [Fusarium oxysporum f. sp. lycopersici 4287]KNB09419.1 glycerol kinase [Fusarium oxysporum f. sp. lycopersici 4287]